MAATSRRAVKDGTARVMEVASGKGDRDKDSMFEGAVTSVSFSPDGRYLAAGGSDKSARVMEAVSGKEISMLRLRGPVTCVNFSPDGRYLAAGSKDNTARVMLAASGQEINMLEFGGPVNCVSFSPAQALHRGGQ